MEYRDQVVNMARAGALKQQREAEARKEEIIRQAKAAALEQVTLAAGVRDAFVTRRRARVELSEEEECALLAEAITFVDAGWDFAGVRRAYDRRRAEEIARQTAVADFRLFWDALGTALKDREKILIDAEKVPGHRQLLLFDPKDFSPPLLGFPPAGPRHEGP